MLIIGYKLKLKYSINTDHMTHHSLGQMIFQSLTQDEN